MRHLFIFALLAALAGCAAFEKLPPAPSVADIIELSKSGASADDIIKRIEASRAVYALPASELARMREQGVPDRVIDYLHSTYIEAVRHAEWARARDAYWFYGPPFRPWPYWGPYGW